MLIQLNFCGHILPDSFVMLSISYLAVKKTDLIGVRLKFWWMCLFSYRLGENYISYWLCRCRRSYKNCSYHGRRVD